MSHRIRATQAQRRQIGQSRRIRPTLRGLLGLGACGAAWLVQVSGEPQPAGMTALLSPGCTVGCRAPAQPLLLWLLAGEELP